MTKLGQSFLQTKWSSIKLAHQHATYVLISNGYLFSFISNCAIMSYCPTQENQHSIRGQSLCRLFSTKKEEEEEGAKVFGLNGADANIISSTILENV